jgi:hypothetical protein
MYLFSRVAHIDFNRAEEAMTFTAGIASVVTEVTGLETHAWSGMYGAPLGRVSWSCRVESHAAMAAASAKLLADEGYQQRIAGANGLFTGDITDTMLDIVAVAGTPGPIGQYASVVRAQCAPGKIASAMTWGVEVLNHVAALTGNSMSLGYSVYGPWATMAWLSTAATMDEIDAANAAMAGDASYIARIDEGGPLFMGGSAEQVLLQRLD